LQAHYLVARCCHDGTDAADHLVVCKIGHHLSIHSHQNITKRNLPAALCWSLRAIRQWREVEHDRARLPLAIVVVVDKYDSQPVARVELHLVEHPIGHAGHTPTTQLQRPELACLPMWALLPLLVLVLMFYQLCHAPSAVHCTRHLTPIQR
jgi:hypothetical protein